MVKKINGFLYNQKTEKQNKQQLKRKKAAVIGEIISRRNFDVPENFISMYVSDDVLDYIVGGVETDIHNIGFYSSVAMLKSAVDSKTIDNYKSFIAIIRNLMERNHTQLNVNFARNEFLQKLTTPMAILTLKTQSEWLAFLKIKRNVSTKSFLSYVFWLVTCMRELNCDIPPVVIDNILKHRYADELRHIVASVSILDFDYFIRQADAQGTLGSNMDIIWAYWSAGGTYFPECTSFIRSMLTLGFNTTKSYTECTRQIMIYLHNVETKNTVKTYGYYLFEYLYALIAKIGWGAYNVFFGTPVNSIWSITLISTAKHMILQHEPDIFSDIFDDIMTNDAHRDINTLEYLFKLPLYCPDKSYLTLRKKFGIDLDSVGDYQDQTLKRTIEQLMVGGEIPLKDMELYRKLFHKCMPGANLMSNFIIHGGRPFTINAANVPEHMNICYTVPGIELMLNYTECDDDILLMFEDEKFVNALKNISVSTQSILNPKCIKRLLCIIMKNPNVTAQFDNLVDHLIRLLGGKPPLECVEYCTMKPSVKIDSAYVSRLIKLLGPDCIEHIPAHILPKNVLMSRLRSGGDVFLKLNTKYLNLDYFMSFHELNDVIMNRDKIQYIPDLSFEYCQRYIDALIEKK